MKYLLTAIFALFTYIGAGQSLIKIHNSGEEIDQTGNMNFINTGGNYQFAPVAIIDSISGYYYIDSTLTCHATGYDKNGDIVTLSYQWYRNDDSISIGTAIVEATNRTYTLTISDNGKWPYCGVIPISNKNPKTGIEAFSERDSASYNYNPLAIALFARMPNQPNSTRKMLINNTIIRLVNNKLFDTKFDIIKCYAVHDSASSLLNWVKNAHNGTPVGKSLTHTNDVGFTGHASDTSYILSNYNPFINAVHYRNSRATLATYVTSNVYEDHTFMIGYSDGGITESASGVIWRYGSLQGKVNEGISGQSDINTTGRNSGFHLYTRIDTNTVASYFNGYLQNTATRCADQVLLNKGLAEFVNIYDKNRRSDQTVAWQFLGDSLNSKEVDSLYNIVTDYMLAVGSADAWGNDTMLVQDFEGTGLDNHSYAYYTGTTYPDYITHPIHGAQSDSIPYGTNMRINLPAYSDTVNVFFSFRLSDATASSNSNILQLRTSTTNVLYLQCQTSGVLKLGVGASTQNATGAISSNTNYYCWIIYIKGTGADAKGYVYYATTKTKPASPNITLTTGNATAKPNNIYFAGANAGGTVIDQIIIKRTALNIIP